MKRMCNWCSQTVSFGHMKQTSYKRITDAKLLHRRECFFVKGPADKLKLCAKAVLKLIRIN